MNAFEVAKLISNFNVAAIAFMAFFAVFGFFAILARFLKWNTFRKRVFFRAFCVAALAAFAAEVTFFNFQYYLKYFADAEIYTTDVSPEAPNVIRTSEGTEAEILVEQHENGWVSSGVRFKELDRRVTSIEAVVEFNDSEVAGMAVRWTDEESTRGFRKNLYRHLPHEHYAILQPSGKVSELTVMFSGMGEGSTINIAGVALNKQIQFYFSGLRLFAFSFLLFAAFLLFNRELRAKAACYFFEYEFNPASIRQNLIYALSVVLVILFSWICVYTSVFPKEIPTSRQYNQFLVDALIAGKVYLDHGNPEKLLNAERPYDTQWLVANGFERDVDWMWDWAWHNGKHYSYFGIVPAIILYVPYKLVTGEYLSNHAGVFLFTAITIILLAMLWRHCVRKYMPDCRFVFYLLSFLTLFFVSGAFAVLRMPSVYTIVQSAGFMFAVAGIFLLFKSVERDEKIGRLKLFFACLCFALVVGCRPNMIFASLLVPVVLWKHRSWKLLLLVSIPYIMVAIPLGWYNYARFGSIFDFGANYNLTSFNMTAGGLLNPIGKVINMFISCANYLFLPNKYSLSFPFAEHFERSTWITFGALRYSDAGSGIINFPIVFCLLYMFKNIMSKERPKAFHILSAFLIIAAVVMVVNSYIVGFMGRYMMDFTTFIVLPSLFCAYYWCKAPKSGLLPNARLKTVYALLAVSIFVGLFLFVKGLSAHPHSDPALYRYLEYSLGIVRNV